MDKCICGHCKDLKVDKTDSQIISGAVFDFASHLTVEVPDMDVALTIEILGKWAKKRGLSLDAPEVLTWHLQSTPLPEIPEKTVVLPVNEHIDVIITEEED